MGSCYKYERFINKHQLGNVWKFVFTGSDFVAESVLYRYKDFSERTVICCSVMSGCPVGCKFCGTGNQFIRNLSSDEIVQQIEDVLTFRSIRNVVETAKRFEIMFMSMGEPMLNWKNVSLAIRELNDRFPNAKLLISTVGINDNDVLADLLSISKDIDNIGLQFSIHKAFDSERNNLIPYKNKLTLSEIRDFGLIWWNETGRHPYLNYCVDGSNVSNNDFNNLCLLFSPVVFNFTFSVVCSKDENMKSAGYKNLKAIKDFENRFIDAKYNTRIFDPAGQDDIGGGCGQLWYVQNWLKEYKTCPCQNKR